MFGLLKIKKEPITFKFKSTRDIKVSMIREIPSVQVWKQQLKIPLASLKAVCPIL